jgi:hypothetical protein
MTAIKWIGTTEQIVSNPDTDTSWYDYTNKQWANAKTADGSYWVWIPRYAYQIENGYHTSTVGTINIKFLMNDTNTTQDSTVVDVTPVYNSERTVQTNFVLHPAFKFGATELTGIWVAKFEPMAAEGVGNGYFSDYTCPNAGDNVNSKKVKIIPNVQSWRCITIGNAFVATRNMETKGVYGWGTKGIGIDTHVIKNIEWGAVAYLSRSMYGKNSKVWINNSSTYTKGCAGNSESEPQYSGCQNPYNTPTGMQASTTGNISSI